MNSFILGQVLLHMNCSRMIRTHLEFIMKGSKAKCQSGLIIHWTELLIMLRKGKILFDIYDIYSCMIFTRIIHANLFSIMLSFQGWPFNFTSVGGKNTCAYCAYSNLKAVINCQNLLNFQRYCWIQSLMQETVLINVCLSTSYE